MYARTNNIIPFPIRTPIQYAERDGTYLDAAARRKQATASHLPEPESRDATPEELVAAAESFLAAVEERLRLRVVK